jgi:hypothetical protein
MSLCFGLPVLGQPAGDPLESPPALKPAPLRERTLGPSRAATAARGAAVRISQVNVAPGQLNIVGDAANEPSIAVDPTDPDRISIGWRQFDSITSDFRQAGVAHSIDGGVTWTTLDPLEPGVFRSDPVLCADRNGVMYYNSLRVLSGSYNTFIFRSTDGGASWSHSIFAFGGDKTWMTVDATAGIGSGNLYQAWNLAGNQYAPATFSRSTDGGLSWSTPMSIPESPIFGTLAVGPLGELYVLGRGTSNRIVVTRSDNAADPGATPSFEAAQPIDLRGFPALNSFVNPAGLAGQLIIDVDRSTGPRSGTVYALGSVNPAGPDPADVYFARSIDRGQTWTTGRRLNDDALGNNAYQWFGTMSVAPNGRIDVIWNDTRNDPTAETSEIFYTYSFDGGDSWAPNAAITIPWASRIGWPQQNKIGDYYDMESDEQGASLACATTFNGEQDVYYIRIGAFGCTGFDRDCTGNGVPDDCDVALGVVFDTNENGVPDSCESPTCYADTNRDGTVNFGDISEVIARWTSFGPVGRKGDASGDGQINSLDITVVLERWLETCP